ncbi:MAG: hypothetical protein Q9225_000774 [Loekoesia sp. 1 TL-2023]
MDKPTEYQTMGMASSVSTILLEPTRPQPPMKRTSIVGGISAFLTTLAAQERRVLELREELEKAENDLSKLKKQWAQHEAIKKRNEFRQQEQLQQLRTAHRLAEGVVQRPNDVCTSLNLLDGSAVGSAAVDQVTCPDSEGKLRHSNGIKQTQRKVFAGSKHTRALSLLSKISTLKASSNQPPHKPISQGLDARQRSASTSDETQKSNRQRLLPHAEPGEPSKGQHKEVFIETGKQLVGDLREGLWTFFEDLRQATVGEEASSTPNYGNKARSNDRYNVKMKDSRKEGNHHTPKTLSRELDKTRPLGIPDAKLVTLHPSEQRAVGKGMQPNMEQARINKNPDGADKPSNDSDDEETWDIWDTPVAKGPVLRNQAESITSGSLASPSTGKNSPRSSMR